MVVQTGTTPPMFADIKVYSLLYCGHGSGLCVLIFIDIATVDVVTLYFPKHMHVLPNWHVFQCLSTVDV